MLDLGRTTVAACGAVSLPLTEIEALRVKPSPSLDRPQVSKTLRNSDEQTVAAVVALLQTVQRRGWQDRSFADWGILGCPRFLGRMIVTCVTSRFFSDPKYSINPHVIPNFCLHSPSGTASVALGMHGRNFGVGGGPVNVPEGLLTALSVMMERRLPGLWLLLTEFDPEPRPDDQGKATNGVYVHAAALAFEADSEGVGELRLVRRDSRPDEESVKELARFIRERRAEPWTCVVDGLGALELAINGPNDVR